MYAEGVASFQDRGLRRPGDDSASITGGALSRARCCGWAWTAPGSSDSRRGAELCASLVADLELGWFEDIFPPGDAAIVAELRRRAPDADRYGRRAGRLYYPEALIQANAVDVVRIDLTCMGGITRGRKLIEQCLQAGVKFAPHMNGIVHSQVFGALGHDVPVEWGVPWTGVDPFADSLRQPEIAADGLMKPLPEEPGFGPLVNRDWVLSQPFDDPDHLLES